MKMKHSALCVLTLALVFVTLLSAHTVVPKDKPGSCPAQKVKGFCFPPCDSDHDCPGVMKCCSSSCGKSCELPVLGPKPGSKPGSCPPQMLPFFPHHPHHPHPCEDECAADCECPRNLKCCYVGCGRQCVCPTLNLSLPETGVFCVWTWAESAGSTCPHLQSSLLQMPSSPARLCQVVSST
ncbi:WAP four-disulfide core domain protein 2-like [Boleophthalmus pectinirostris]|uniref:WAP four-disulfide core domain protein 2-like n=1 Tax=Boleophthalmus pectinirostris TaxID=150288 RepID=UPI00242D4676|nr:WAP four-disulfide core domain protein 2-like [Boleophthalmus pectinirostris]